MISHHPDSDGSKFKPIIIADLGLRNKVEQAVSKTQNYKKYV